MGLDYSLCAILPRDQSAYFLEHLAQVLDVSSRRRIQNLVWSPALQSSDMVSQGIAGLLGIEHEQENYYAFSLQVKLEREMKAYLVDYTFNCFDQANVFGSMYTSVFAGTEYLLVQMTAASSDMSRVLENSSAIHKLWAQFAKASKAILAYVDLEAEAGILVFPRSETCVIPANETFACFEGPEFDVDEMTRFMRQVNKV
jgi:hypothetical protein